MTAANLKRNYSRVIFSNLVVIRKLILPKGTAIQVI